MERRGLYCVIALGIRMKRIDSKMSYRKLIGGKSGFSLLELMISVSILAVSLLGLLSLTATSIQANLENDVRNASTRLITQTSEILLAQPIDGLVTCGLHADATVAGYTAGYTYTAANACLGGGGGDFARYPNPLQTIRGSMTYPYNITWNVFPLTNDLKQATITIAYSYRGKVVQKDSVIYVHRTL